jgi:hypothetical protein
MPCVKFRDWPGKPLNNGWLSIGDEEVLDSLVKEAICST